MAGGDNTDDFRLLGDEPCVRDTDALGFDEIARGLSDLILASANSTPFSVGIEGGWGEGKSSLMGRIERELKKNGKPIRREWWARLWRWFRARRSVRWLVRRLNARWLVRWLIARRWRWRRNNSDDRILITTVRFNAWTAGEGDVLEGLVKSVLDELDESILRYLARKDRLISWARSGFAVVVHLLGLGSVVDRVWDQLAVDPMARNQIRDLMVDALRDWGAQEPEMSSERLLVVFIDDLDRCTPRGVFQVFEAMKLYLDAPGLAFVVGFDPGMVSEAVLKEKGYDRPEIDDYLEKVIQTRFEIPSTTRDQAGRLMENCMASSGTSGVFDENAQRLVLERNEFNPRRVKRFVNSFILEYRLGNRDELEPHALIWVLILKFYFARFVDWLLQSTARNPLDDFLDYVNIRELLLRQEDYSPQETERIVDLLRSHKVSFEAVGASSKGRHANLTAFEGEIVDEIPVLVAEDARLPNLVRQLADEVPHDVLIRALRRRPVAEFRPSPPQPDKEHGVTAAGIDDGEDPLRGLNVLWITDDEDGDSPHMNELRARGVRVQLVRDLEEARPELKQQRPDALLSDITRDGDDGAGLRDLRTIREQSLYRGPALLFTSQVTSTRRDKAKKAKAEITSSWHDVFTFLRQAATHP